MMRHFSRPGPRGRPIALAAAIAVGLAGCGGDGGGGGGGGGGDRVPDGGPDNLPTAAPTELALVTDEGFVSPQDAVASPDGSTFYFTAYTIDALAKPAVFRVASSGGAVTTLHAGSPLGYPTGLVAACDGSAVFIAEMGIVSAPIEEDVDELETSSEGASLGGIYRLATAGGAPEPILAEGLGAATGLAMGPDCSTLYATGWTPEGDPALFKVSVAGGTATVVLRGEPLMSPTGVHVDADNVAWVMDHLAANDEGEGVLFAIDPMGQANAVIGGLRMGTPGGVSLTAGGGTAVIPVTNEAGDGQLLAVEIASGMQSIVDAPELTDPAGIRTAREAGVFAVVDSEGSAIYRAE